jgi:hypothetical protein
MLLLPLFLPFSFHYPMPYPLTTSVLYLIY